MHYAHTSMHRSLIYISTKQCFAWGLTDYRAAVTWEWVWGQGQERERERESRREEVQRIYRCYVYVLLSECWLVCHLPSTSALVPNDGGVQRANYPHSGASPQASATSLHQGLPSSHFTLGPFQRHTHTQSQWQIIHIMACLKVGHSTSLSSLL